MPCNFSIPKIIVLVNALAKLHNFCINEKEGNADILLNVDEEYIMTNEDGYIEMVSDGTHDILVPAGLMDCGNHFQDVPRAYRRSCNNSSNPNAELPRKVMHDKIVNLHACHPNRITK